MTDFDEKCLVFVRLSTDFFLESLEVDSRSKEFIFFAERGFCLRYSRVT